MFCSGLCPPAVYGRGGEEEGLNLKEDEVAWSPGPPRFRTDRRHWAQDIFAIGYTVLGLSLPALLLRLLFANC